MRKREFIQIENLKGIISSPDKPTKKILILLHGVGANEKGLVEVGEMLAPDSLVVSLRAPLVLGIDSYGWFHVQFGAAGPQHNWQEAESSLLMIEKEILSLAKKYDVPLSNIAVMGFSQGSIMTMGLALRSSLQLGHYLCFSGRTLPEFAQYAEKHPEISKGRKIFLTHGTYDQKLPVELGKTSKGVLENVKANFHFYEFPGGHEIPSTALNEARRWFSE